MVVDDTDGRGTLRIHAFTRLKEHTMKGKKVVPGPLRSKWAWLSVVLLGGILVLSRFDIRESSREMKASEVTLQSHTQITMHEADTGTIDCGPAGFPGESIPMAHQYHPKGASDRSKAMLQESCKSKYLQHCFWRATKKIPSPAYLSALREYEEMHERCVKGHNLTEHFLKGTTPAGCQYVVWRDMDGKGNQLISLVSAFLYSLLTHRALLITPDASLQHLLCEPFPRSSWLVSEGFPEQWMREKSAENQQDLYIRAENLTRGNGSILQRNSDKVFPTPNHLNVGLSNYSPHQARRFFCSTEQKLLARIPWLLFRSNQFSAPGLYFVPEFRELLNKLFPDKALFLHTGRYLFSPTNQVWDRIARYYDTYLAPADTKLGIQVRTWTNSYKPIISQHILQCGIATQLLPNLTNHNTSSHDPNPNPNPNGTPPQHIAVLMAALGAEYHHDLRESFLVNGNEGNHRVMVVSPSSERKQQTGLLEHDKKAIADMWLLSFTDSIISSPRSTFGHVAHGLAGITPIVFQRWGIDESQLPDQLCGSTNLPGPCFIDHPEHMICPLDPPGAGGVGDVDDSVPEVRHCLHQWGVGVYES